LADIGINYKLSMRSQRVAEIPAETFEQNGDGENYILKSDG